MKGLLRKVFVRVGFKRLRAVEVDSKRSHQHEFDGVAAMRMVLGSTERKNIPCVFVWLGGPQEAISERGEVSWYDSRANKPERAPEWRLYYGRSGDGVMSLCREDDGLFTAETHDGNVYLIVTTGGSTTEAQLLQLFGLLEDEETRILAREISVDDDEVSDFILQFFLDELGLRSFDEAPDYLEEMKKRFGDRFPSPRLFSEFARSTCPDMDALDADASLMMWVSREDQLYRQFEEFLIDDRFSSGFTSDDSGAAIDSFLQLSQSLQNRRRLRGGWALENHLKHLLDSAGIAFSRGSRAEGAQMIPDFLFPGAEEVRISTFPVSLLTRLSVMSTSSGAWRKVLAGRNRTPLNHLLTLDPGLLESETDAMLDASVKLVVPKSLQATYVEAQRRNLLTLNQFLRLVKGRQEDSTTGNITPSD